MHVPWLISNLRKPPYVTVYSHNIHVHVYVWRLLTEPPNLKYMPIVVTAVCLFHLVGSEYPSTSTLTG